MFKSFVESEARPLYFLKFMLKLPLYPDSGTQERPSANKTNKQKNLVPLVPCSALNDISKSALGLVKSNRSEPVDSVSFSIRQIAVQFSGQPKVSRFYNLRLKLNIFF